MTSVPSTEFGESYSTPSLDTRLLLEEAASRGIHVETVGRSDAYELTLGEHTEYIFYQWNSSLLHIGYVVSTRKHAAKAFLQREGISVADGIHTRDVSVAVSWADKNGYPVVMKPAYGTHGDYVYTGIDSPEEVKKLFTTIRKARKMHDVIVEEQFEGTEYRVFATRDRCLAVTNRVPANVIGDGVLTIQELIDKKNQDPQRGEKDPNGAYSTALLHIEIDDIVKAHIKEHKISLSDVPKKGEQVFLRLNSNLSTGGDSIDVTDDVHQDVKDIAVRAVRAIPGLPYAGVDFLTTDVKAPQTPETHIIIELNPVPMLSMHHMPAEGKSRNVAGGLIDDLFPETKK